MPHIPISYANTIIYKIVCNDLNIKECYVGHTTNFTERKRSHKSRCIKESGTKFHLKLYCIIRSNGGWDNYSMVEVEKYPCNDVNEAMAREREHYEILNCNLNTQIPHQSLKDTRRTYYDKIAEKLKEKITCECGRIIQTQEMYRHIKSKIHNDLLFHIKH